MKNLIIMCTVIFLVGCVPPTDEARESMERNMLQNYRCTAEQLDIVQREIDMCPFGYFESDCLRYAKISQCDYIGYRAPESVL